MGCVVNASSTTSCGALRDNLWALGGELMRRRYDDDELTRGDVKDALRQLIDGDAGPLIWPHITESQQDALDATCRKLNRFLRDRAAMRSSVPRED